MKKLLLACALGLSLLSSNSFAQLNNKGMMDKIKKEYPKLPVEEVTYIPEVKLYELRLAGTPVLSYTDENLDFLLTSGEIIDVKNRVSITNEREMLNVKRFFKSLPFNTAIKIQYGKGTRSVAIFTDPDCPFCKATDKEIHTKLANSDLTVYYFMNPLVIPGHEQAPLEARKIYCSPDKSKAWLNWMLNGQLPNNDGSCSTPLDLHKKIAMEVNFLSTPTLVFDNGYIFRGGMTADQIKEILAKKAP